MIVAGTGHRPNKLGGYSPFVFDKLVTIAMEYLESTTPELVISGMALGWDQALAQAAINLNIPLMAAIPCLNQESKWPLGSQLFYKSILSKAESIVWVSEEPYTKKCMNERNKFMVDHCNLVLAMYDGTKGGTHNCIEYAKSKDKQIINLFDKL